MDNPLLFVPRRRGAVIMLVIVVLFAASVVAQGEGREATRRNQPPLTLGRNDALLLLAAGQRGASVAAAPRLNEHDAIFSLSRSKFSRWKQRCRHRRLNKRVPIHKAKVEAVGRRGTCLRIFWGHGPRDEEDAIIADLFGADRHSAHHPVPFNHNMVGMTNPCLHIGVKEDRTLVTIPASSSSSSARPGVAEEGCGGVDEDGAWWPGTACLSDDDGQEESKYAGWKVVRLRRRVGRSHACYQAVRDAALKWEFDAGDVGIARVHSAPGRRTLRHRNPEAAAASNDQSSGYSIAPGFARVDAAASSIDPTESSRRRHAVVASEEEFDDAFRPTASDHVQQIWSGPGSRRLVTYTAQPSNGPVRIVAMNPVGVVYDLVDQRGGDGTTTYTSTAYATLRGHWLTGEERVTVALRDTGSVDVEILSFARPSPSSWPGRALWPLLGGMQRRFFEQQLNALERVASQSATTAVPSGPMPGTGIN